jgi:DNA repair photolyase
MSLFYSNIDNRKFNTWCKYTVRLDTYGCGCQHDCNYCYAKSLLNFRGLWNSEAPKVATLWEIKKCISEMPKNKVVKLGGMTDCFMPIELKHKITYNTIKLLNHYKIHYLIVTKSHIVANDEYLKIYDKNLAHFQITITSTSDEISKSIEKASFPNKRIQAIETLQLNGFDVSVRLSPFIPEYIDINIINAIRCNKILIEFLKVNHWVKKWFNIDYSKYSLKYGGYEHLQLESKIELVNKITGFEQKSVGEYVKEHFEYFNTNVNFNKNDCCNLSVKFIEILKPKQLALTFNKARI